jgi:branched-chain amino acid transport system permease protein
VGTLVVLGIFQNLTIYGSYYAFVIMGLLLVVVVVFLPEGLIPGLVKLFGRHRKRKEGMS